MEDLIIIKRIQNWEKNLFWKIYEKYVDEIYKFIYLKTTNTEISEDLTSETFFSALKNIFKVDTNSKDANFRARIYKIAYNKTINYYKVCDRETGICEYIDLPCEQDFAWDLDNKEEIKNILSYLKTLSDNERNVIIYRIWHDLSFKEISEILWISLNNCKKISSRTLKKINSNFLILLFIFLIF